MHHSSFPMFEPPVSFHVSEHIPHFHTGMCSDAGGETGDSLVSSSGGCSTSEHMGMRAYAGLFLDINDIPSLTTVGNGKHLLFPDIARYSYYIQGPLRRPYCQALAKHNHNIKTNPTILIEEKLNNNDKRNSVLLFGFDSYFFRSFQSEFSSVKSKLNGNKRK